MPRVDYHFLYLDPTLEADWLFAAARRYWETFRPMVIADLELISYVPARRVVAITALARRDMAPSIATTIKKRYPAAYYDPLVYDFVNEMQLTLDGRADLHQRFGLPEEPTPIPPRSRKR